MFGINRKRSQKKNGGGNVGNAENMANGMGVRELEWEYRESGWECGESGWRCGKSGWDCGEQGLECEESCWECGEQNRIETEKNDY